MYQYFPSVFQVGVTDHYEPPSITSKPLINPLLLSADSLDFIAKYEQYW